MQRLLFMLAGLAVFFCLCTGGAAIAAEGTHHGFNPFYEHLIKDVVSGLRTTLDAPAVCSSYDAVKAALKENLKNRATAFSFQMVYDFSFEDVGAILSQAMDEIRDADDYLHWNMVSWDSGWSGWSGDVTVTYNPVQYLTTAAEELSVNQRVSEILLAILTGTMTDEQKEVAIHDWIVANVAYDTTLVEHSAWAALDPERGYTVCQGYALLAYKMLMTAGVPARIVASDAMNHAWNMVNLCGSWFHVDVSWDDPIPDVPGRVLYTFFNKSDEEIGSGDHPHYDWDAPNLPLADVSYVAGICIAPGDIDHLAGVTLSDAVLALQIVSGLPVAGPVFVDADVDKDGRIGHEEAGYILQVVAGTRD